MLAGDLLDGARGTSTAMIFEDQEWSYAALDALANRYANYFRCAGLRRGDRVSMLVGNDVMLVGAYFGAFRAGLVANPINTRLTASEIAYIVNHADARCAVVGNDMMPVFEQVKRLLAQPPLVLALGPEALKHVDAGAVRVESIEGDDDALLIYTSGTTGKPKGVLLTHSNVVSAALLVRDAFEMTPADRTFCVMPLFHTNALMFSHLPFLAAGGSVGLQRKFSASRFWDECKRHGASSSSASPTILALLLEHEATGPPRGGTGLKYLKVASAPTPVELAERFESRFGAGLLLETFGLTETTAISTMNPLEGRRKFGSIGKVLPPQALRILDNNGHDLPVGEVGEIALSGPTIMKGYLKDPANTARAFADGWFLTGDMGRLDADGFAFIVGRKKEMILRGGENISPLEIEEVANRHPDVRESAVVGLPDAIWGEAVGLCVVRQGAVTTEELLGFCRSHLSAFKVPERVAFVDELPRNAMGKVVRTAVLDAFIGGLP